VKVEDVTNEILCASEIIAHPYGIMPTRELLLGRPACKKNHDLGGNPSPIAGWKAHSVRDGSLKQLRKSNVAVRLAVPFQTRVVHAATEDDRARSMASLVARMPPA
jgi:hypothetical protein